MRTLGLVLSHMALNSFLRDDCTLLRCLFSSAVQKAPNSLYQPVRSDWVIPWPGLPCKRTKDANMCWVPSPFANFCMAKTGSTMVRQIISLVSLRGSITGDPADLRACFLVGARLTEAAIWTCSVGLVPREGSFCCSRRATLACNAFVSASFFLSCSRSSLALLVFLFGGISFSFPAKWASFKGNKARESGEVLRERWDFLLGAGDELRDLWELWLRKRLLLVFLLRLLVVSSRVVVSLSESSSWSELLWSWPFLLLNWEVHVFKD